MSEDKNDYNSLTHQAYMQIKKQIVSGRLKQGQVISISAMAKQLGISRTPLTYACQKLEHDKFLTIVPKQGVIVNTVTVTDAKEIYELRAAIEGYSASRSYNNFSVRDIDYLEKSFDKQLAAVEKNDIHAFMVEDNQFHKYILSKYENSQFLSLINTLYDRAFLLGLQSCQNPVRLQQCVQEHRNIIDALKDNNREAFLKSLDENILNGYTSLTNSYIF
jgi:DNA-binding GntR family transcriptional regulator